MLSNDSFFELYENAPCGLMVTTEDGLILSANKTLCDWLGYKPEHLIGILKLQALLSIGSRLFHHTHWAPLIRMQGSVSEVQLEMISCSNKKIPIILNAIAKQKGNDTFIEFALFTSFDRSKYEHELLLAKQTAEGALKERLEVEQSLIKMDTELRALNEQLYYADKRKDEFLATLAHELRNPLAPMRNVLEILKLRQLEDPQLEWSRQLLDRQVLQLTHLVDDLMEISRITQGRVELKLTKIDISTVIKHAVESAEPAANAAKHKLIVNLPSTHLIVNADQTRLIQMVLNLLNNAIKYTPHGGTITIWAEELENNVLISVKDTGIGIEENQLQSIFQMFSQVESAIDRSKGGLGIGLALVWGLVGLHGGTIQAFSEGLGQGSEFQITMPLSDSSEMIEHQNYEKLAVSGNGQRILVIDDDVDITESFSIALELLGYEVQVANSGLEGIELASTFKPDIILLDIGLPNLNGYEVAKLVRKEAWGETITLIAATGWGQSQDIELAMDAGFDNHLTKPIDFKELDRILNPKRI